MERGGNMFVSQNRVKTNLQIQQAVPIQSDIFDFLQNQIYHLNSIRN